MKVMCKSQVDELLLSETPTIKSGFSFILSTVFAVQAGSVGTEEEASVCDEAFFHCVIPV